MLKSYFDNRRALDVLVPNLRAEKAVRGFKGSKGIPLTAAETETVGHLLQLLFPCKDVTIVLQGTKYVTASHAGVWTYACLFLTVIRTGPLVRTCSARAKQVAASLPADSQARPIAAALAAAIESRFSSTHKYEIIAMMLDPRFKRPIDDYLAPAWEELGKHFGLEVAVFKMEQQRAAEKAEAEKAETEKDKNKEKKSKDKSMSGKDEKDEKKAASNSTPAAASATTTWEPRIEDLVRVFGMGQMEDEKVQPEQELTEYLLKEPVVSIKTNPLEWWRSKREKYPVLSRLARKFLCLQATSVASERVWSTAGNVLTSRRSRLHPLALEALVLIHENYTALKQAHELDPKMIESVQTVLAEKLTEEKKSE